MALCFHNNRDYITKLCRAEWEKGGRKGGAFLSKVFVTKGGKICYDLMNERRTLVGYAIAKVKGVWKLVTAAEAETAHLDNLVKRIFANAAAASAAV